MNKNKSIFKQFKNSTSHLKCTDVIFPAVFQITINESC